EPDGRGVMGEAGDASDAEREGMREGGDSAREARHAEREARHKGRGAAREARHEDKDAAREARHTERGGNHRGGGWDKGMGDFAAFMSKASKSVFDFSYNFAEKISDKFESFVNANNFNTYGSYPLTEKSFSFEASEAADIRLKALNGFINVVKGSGSKVAVTAHIKAKTKDPGDCLSGRSESGQIAILPNDGLQGVSISYTMEVPELAFGTVSLETANAKVSVEDLSCRSLEVRTRNGSVDLVGVACEDLDASTKNAAIRVGYASAGRMRLTTKNAIVEFKHVKAGELHAESTNGRICGENVINADGFETLRIEASTSNSQVKINMFDMDDRGYRLECKARQGVDYLVPNIEYGRKGEDGTICAESVGYGDYAKKVRIKAECVNGSIEIMK
ncbi:MAG: DUF4097 family beta strand repeat-containing protein, partial [Oscillospiraceae bacterium]|nr:DUF4097 family beta strand repeat-containing protein [Oscillospiraceae bacterium]